MSDDEIEDGSPAPAAPGWEPALDHIVQAVPGAPGVEEAATYLNDYVQRRNIADANEAAAQNFASDLSDFRDGMKQFVTADPTLGAVQATMKATAPMVQGVVGTTGHPDADEHAGTLTRHIHGEIASAAVTSAAEKDANHARMLLDHPDISGALATGEADSLRNYIDMQDRARALDQHIQDREQAMAADTRAGNAMFGYAAQLRSPDTGSPVFPSRWNQRVLADNSVPPGDTAVLRQLYGRLAVDGGPTTSDPWTAHQMVSDIASGDAPHPREVLSQVAGGNLRFNDALHLSSIPRESAAALNGLLDFGRQAIMASDPIAGARAYGRFVNWVLPAFEQTGPAGAAPTGDVYLLRNGLASFMPRVEDALPAAPREGRRPLKEIFGG